MKKSHPFTPRLRLGAFALGFFLTFFASALAWARETRLPIVVGNNGSATLSRAELRYADDDAAKYAALFTSTSQEEDVELLARFDADTTRLFPAQAKKAGAPTKAALESAVGRIAARARAARDRGDQVVFTFVFAGHGDVEDGRGFLELEDGRFFREDLESLLTRMPAVRAHVLLDACNSVYMLVARKPGGTRFTTPEEIERSMAARLAHVGTFVSTSADAQVYEWSRIESGVFSHSIRSGLSGAADLDGDGRVTYGELRAFVRIAAAGVPNPRFRPRIYARGPGGKDDEVVFEPRAAGAARKLELAPGPERRVTVLDADEVPLIDAKLEHGFGTNVYVPALGGSPENRSYTLVEQEDRRRGHRRVGHPVRSRHARHEEHRRWCLHGSRRDGLASSMQLFSRSTMEERRDAYVHALRGDPREMELAVRDAEKEIFEMATIARRERIVEGIGSFVFGALELGGAIALLAATDDPNLHWLAGGLVAASVGSVATGTGRLAVRSEEERLADLWRTERSAPTLARSSKIQPNFGLGGIGLSGTF